MGFWNRVKVNRNFDYLLHSFCCKQHSAVQLVTPWTFMKKRRICVVLKMTRVVDGFLNAVGKNGGWSQQWIRCAVRSLLHMYYVYMYAALNCLFRKKNALVKSNKSKKNFFSLNCIFGIFKPCPCSKIDFRPF